MASKIWWLIHKDLVVEYRARQAWPAMLLLGVIVAVMFSMQVDLPAQQRTAVAAGLLWLAVLFAGLVAIERASAVERPDACWDGLMLYPLAPSCIFLAKLTVNVVALLVLECVLIPLFVVLAEMPLLGHPWLTLLVALLGSVPLSAVGTIVGTLAHGLRYRGAILPVLVLPLVVPVLLAAAEATRLIAENQRGDELWHWVQLLGACSVLFVTVGVVLFDFLAEA